jgi:hypothetical protein
MASNMISIKPNIYKRQSGCAAWQKYHKNKLVMFRKPFTSRESNCPWTGIRGTNWLLSMRLTDYLRASMSTDKSSILTMNL